MPRLTKWTRESRTPTLAYRHTETDARAVLHRAPNSYVHKWRAAILVEDYPVWSRGFATKDATSLRDELEKRPEPALRCPECPNDEVVVGQKSTDGAKIQRWFECRECGYESRSAIVYGPER
jgi:DNA-directed RNA polymerase subunit M/transcription elongation factor TFIIS